MELGKSSHYDLILIDIQLPGTNGAEITKALRAYGIHTPTIATTANFLTEDRESFLAAGVSDVLTKPFRQEQILDIIARWTKPARAK